LQNYPLSFVKISDNETRIEVLGYQNRLDGVGVGLDVFPIDGLSQYGLIGRIEHFVIGWLVGIKNTIIFSNNVGASESYLKRFARKVVVKHISVQMILCIIDEIAKVHKGAESYGCRIEPYCGRESVGVADYFPLTTLAYEGMLFPAPNNYDEILTQLYGDYMTPPSKENRQSTHMARYFVET
jgi:lipopolysaccharide cholinephosphotransferase